MTKILPSVISESPRLRITEFSPAGSPSGTSNASLFAVTLTTVARMSVVGAIALADTRNRIVSDAVNPLPAIVTVSPETDEMPVAGSVTFVTSGSPSSFPPSSLLQLSSAAIPISIAKNGFL